MFYKVRHLSLGEEKKEKKLPNTTEFIGSKLGLELSFFLQMYTWMTTVLNTAHNTAARKNIISHVNNNAL